MRDTPKVEQIYVHLGQEWTAGLGLDLQDESSNEASPAGRTELLRCVGWAPGWSHINQPLGLVSGTEGGLVCAGRGRIRGACRTSGAGHYEEAVGGVRARGAERASNLQRAWPRGRPNHQMWRCRGGPPSVVVTTQCPGELGCYSLEGLQARPGRRQDRAGSDSAQSSYPSPSVEIRAGRHSAARSTGDTSSTTLQRAPLCSTCLLGLSRTRRLGEEEGEGFDSGPARSVRPAPPLSLPGSAPYPAEALPSPEHSIRAQAHQHK